MIQPAAIAVALLAAGLISADAAAPDLARYPTGVTVANGRCTALSVGGKDTQCDDVVLSLQYNDGGRSMAVKAGDGMISFFGKPDETGIVVALVTGVRPGEGTDKTATASEQVTGRCTPAAIAAKTQIDCQATASDGGRYAFTFVTDDKAPDRREFRK